MVFDDVNGDGMQSGEPGVPGLQLYVDINQVGDPTIGPPGPLAGLK